MIIQNKKSLINQIMGDPNKAEGPEEGSLHVCMTEFVNAVHEKDISGAESAFKACFAACEAEPHEEGPHTEED